MKSALTAFALVAAVTAVPALATPVPIVQTAVATGPIDPIALSLAREFVALTSPPEASEKQFVEQLKAFFLMMPGAEAPTEAKAASEWDKTLYAAGPVVRQLLPSYNEAYAVVYAREYTAAELQQLVAFARTSVGTRFFTKATEHAADPSVVAAGQNLLTEAFKAIEDSVKTSMCRRAAEARLAAGDQSAKCNRA